MTRTSPAQRRARRRSERVRLLAQALVLTAVVAGTSAFAVLHKTVTVDVDGAVSTVSAFGRTVADVLADQGVVVVPGDLVFPAPGDRVANGSEIVVRHGRDVVVEIDGVRTAVWTTAQTVDEVLAELDFRQEVLASASRSAPLGRDLLRVSTAKDLTVAVDGQAIALATTAVTVREAVAEAGVVLGEHDQVSVALDAQAVDGLMIMITRVQGVLASETTALPFQSVRQDDETLDTGREVVEVHGREGSSTVTFWSYQVNGAEIGRSVLAERVITPPVDELIRVGTFVPPPPPPTPAVAAVEPGTARAIGLELTLARGWDENQFACLDALWTKESGWRSNAHNSSSGAHGIPQALPGSKMASAGADWETNAATQITWGLGYIAGRYATPCGAWEHSVARNWY